jgi:hypothetical protein
MSGCRENILTANNQEKTVAVTGPKVWNRILDKDYKNRGNNNCNYLNNGRV